MIYDENKPSSILYQCMLNISRKNNSLIYNSALHPISLFNEFDIKLKLEFMPCFRILNKKQAMSQMFLKFD